MDIREFSKLIQSKKNELEDLFRRKMPVHAGRIAKDHYQDNFRQSGYVDNGLHPWQKSKRLSSGSLSADANYSTLMSSRNNLFSSIRYVPGDGRVTISNNAPYASVHNFGGTVAPTVTPRMRRFAWAKYYEAGGGKKKATNGNTNGKNAQPVEDNTAARFWKQFALTKKTKLSIKMPERKFLGESAELSKKITDKTETEIRKILNS